MRLTILEDDLLLQLAFTPICACKSIPAGFDSPNDNVSQHCSWVPMSGQCSFQVGMGPGRSVTLTRPLSEWHFISVQLSCNGSPIKTLVQYGASHLESMGTIWSMHDSRGRSAFHSCVCALALA